jgi:SAM-dependent MidA family methyltransferase
MRLPPTRSPAPWLPEPPPDECSRSGELAALIRAEIGRAGGEIPFSRFMALALYAPGLGYYAAGRGVPGARGDFVTAPEIGNLFARCIARQCVTVLRATQGDILEAGGGSGRMCADVLLELEALDCLPDRYLILDLSAALRGHQQETIRKIAPHLLNRVVWLDALPERFSGVALANELLDAMPVEIVRIKNGRVAQMGIGIEGDRFIWREQAVPTELADLARERIASGDRPDGYTSEINLNAEGWVRAAGDWLHSGVLFIFDYGFPRAEYFHPDRHRGTLMCHYRQRAHDDPLLWPGLQDITAHVDFTSIAQAAREAGLDCLGYTTQGAFLLGAGIAELAGAHQRDPVQAMTLAAEIRKLTLPHEMGELFKVIAFGRDFGEPLSGFRFARGRL